MEFVYILWHTHETDDGDEDFKMIGAYSSESIAKTKIEIFKKLPGFNTSPEGFEIVRYQIDHDHWQEGFITE